MNPINLSDLEVESLGYANRDEFDYFVEQARAKIGDEVYGYEPTLLKKKFLVAYAPEAPPFKQVQAAQPATTQEDIRLRSPRTPDDTQAKLYAAAQAALAKSEEMALQEGKALTDSERQSISGYVGRTLSTPRAPDASATWSPLANIVDKIPGVPDKIVDAFRPQEIMSQSQIDEYEKSVSTRKQQGEWDAVNYYREHKAEFPGIDEAQFLDTARTYTNDFHNWSPVDTHFYSMKNIARATKNIIETGDWVDPELNTEYQKFVAEGGDKTMADPRAGVVSAISKPTDAGLYETPLFATLRGFVAPESLVGAGIAKGLGSDKSFTDELSSRIAKGEGLEKSGSDIARYFGAEPGSAADDIGWYMGLAAGFLMPADLGITDLAKGSTKVLATGGLKVLGVDLTEAGEHSAIKKVLALSDRTVDELRAADPSLLDLRDIAIHNADLIEEPNAVARVLALVDPDYLDGIRSERGFADYIKSRVALVADPANVQKAYDDFMAKAKSLGLNDITGGIEEAGKVATKLPLGDTPLAWKRFIKQAIATRDANYGRKGATQIIGGVEVVNPVDYNNLRRTIASNIVKRKVDEAIATGILPGREMTMLTPTVAIPTQSVKPFLTDLRTKAPMVELQKLVENFNGEIPEATINAIADAVPRSVLLRTKIYDAVEAAKKSGTVTSIPITRGELNTIVDNLVGYYASKSAGGQTITELSTLAKRTDQVIKSSAGISEKFKAAVTKLNLEATFNPTMLRPTGFKKLWKDYVSPVLVAYAPNQLQRTIMSPLESYTRTTLVTRLGAISDVYKSDYDKFLQASGSNHDEALAATIFNQFKIRYGDAGSLVVDYESFWVNYIAALYGGYDSVVETQILRSGTKTEHLLQKEQLVDNLEDIYKDEGLQDTILGQLARAYKEATTDVERLRIVGATSKLLEGRPLGDFVKATGVQLPDLARVELPAQVKGLRPLFADNQAVPLYATYVQQYQLNAVKDIRAGLISSSGALSPNSIDAAIKNTEDYLTQSITGDLTQRLIKQSGSPAKEIRELVATNNIQQLLKQFVLDDYIYSTSLRVSYSPPTHVEALVVKLKETIATAGHQDIGQVGISELTKSEEKLISRIIKPLGYETHNGHIWKSSVIETPGDNIFNTLVGQTNVALTDTEIRAWSASLYDQAKRGFFTTGKSAYDVLDSSGLYDLSEVSRILSNAVPLKDIEKAFTSFEYLKDVRWLNSLPQAERIAVMQSLQATTLPAVERIQKAISQLGPDINTGVVSQILQWMTVVFYDSKEFAFNGLPNFIKNNLLGGGFAPNLVYHFQNYISGPMLLHTTLTSRESIFSFMTDYNLLPEKLVVTPSGRSYTASELDALMMEGGVNSSTISAEIKTNMLRDMVEYNSTTLRGTVEMKRGFFKNLAKHVGFDGLSTYNQLAQQMDLAYRKKAMAEALRSGMSEPQAIEVARRALFDYNDLTGFERKYIAKYLWFYRFMRQNLVQTAVAFIDNPAKIVRMAKLSKFTATKMFQDHINPDIQDYKDSRSFIALIDGQDKQRLAVYTPSMPTLEAAAQVMDTMSFFAVMSAVVGSSEKPDALTISKATENLIARFNANPVLVATELATQSTFGVKIQLENEDTITWLDPRFVAWAKASGMWNDLNSLLAIEMVADDPRAGVTTFDGYYYKIQPESQVAWQAIMETLKVVGVQRSLRDYSSILQLIDVDGMKPGTDIQTTPTYDILRTAGILQVAPIPTIEQAQQNVRREVSQSIGGK